MITYIEGKELILQWLQKKYAEKGNKDFIFLSHYIARDINISNKQIGHLLGLLQKDGIIINENRKKSARRWVTKFNASVPVKRKSFFKKLLGFGK